MGEISTALVFGFSFSLLTATLYGYDRLFLVPLYFLDKISWSKVLPFTLNERQLHSWKTWWVVEASWFFMWFSSVSLVFLIFSLNFSIPHVYKECLHPLFFFFFFFFFATLQSTQDLIPWPGVEHVLPAVETWILNHWTAREVLPPFLFTFSWGSMVGFPDGSEGKASACNMGDLGSIPGSGRSLGEGNGNPLQYEAPW